MTKTMKAAVIREPGGPDVLKIEEHPVPAPGPGEVLIRVKAFGLNCSPAKAIPPTCRFPAFSASRP